MGAQGLVTFRQILHRHRVEIAESGDRLSLRCSRGPSQRPQGILQALGQGDVALAAQHDMNMFEPAIGQTKMVKQVIEGLPGDLMARSPMSVKSDNPIRPGS